MHQHPAGRVWDQFQLAASLPEYVATGTTDPAVGVHTYAENEVVPITATPDSGYIFDYWTGDVADVNSAITTVTMDVDQSVTAHFAEAPPSAITYIGDVGANSIKDTGNPDLVVTTTSGVAAGDDIIIAYATDPTQDLNLDITDTAGNTYQQSAMGINVGNLRTYIFAAYDVSALSGGDTITITAVTEYPDSYVLGVSMVVVSYRRLSFLNYLFLQPLLLWSRIPRL